MNTLKRQGLSAIALTLCIGLAVSTPGVAEATPSRAATASTAAAAPGTIVATGHLAAAKPKKCRKERHGKPPKKCRKKRPQPQGSPGTLHVGVG